MSGRNSQNTIIYIVAILTGIGVVAVYSVTSARSASREITYLPLVKHLLWVGIGCMGMVAAALIDLKKLQRYDRLFLGVSVALLVLVLLIGTEVNGARRWIRFGRHFGFQPSELAKLAMIIFIAGFATRNREQLKEFKRGFVRPLIVIAVVCGLIVKEPDLGTAVLIGCVAVAMLYVAGARILHLILLGLSGVPVVAYLIIAAPYRLQRVLVFLNPWKDPSRAGYHVIQSLIALGSGGIWGRGLGNSHQKLYFLPESSTDFIFSIIGEELGFIGTFAIMCAFVLLIREGVKIALRAADYFSALLAMGVSMAIGMQAIINIGVVSGAMPTKGIALPFVSMGGSALFVSMVGAGILVNVARQSEKERVEESTRELLLRGGYAYGK